MLPVCNRFESGQTKRGAESRPKASCRIGCRRAVQGVLLPIGTGTRVQSRYRRSTADRETCPRAKPLFGGSWLCGRRPRDGDCEATYCASLHFNDQRRYEKQLKEWTAAQQDTESPLFGTPCPEMPPVCTKDDQQPYKSSQEQATQQFRALLTGAFAAWIKAYCWQRRRRKKQPPCIRGAGAAAICAGLGSAQQFRHHGGSG